MLARKMSMSDKPILHRSPNGSYYWSIPLSVDGSDPAALEYDLERVVRLNAALEARYPAPTSSNNASRATRPLDAPPTATDPAGDAEWIISALQSVIQQGGKAIKRATLIRYLGDERRTDLALRRLYEAKRINDGAYGNIYLNDKNAR